MINEPVQNQESLGMSLSRFQETCSFATRDTFVLNYDSPEEEIFVNSYEQSEEMLDQLATNLMKDTWNIPLDE